MNKIARQSVLVVDDEPDIVEEIVDALGDEGFQVYSASSVDEALTLLTENRSIETVITDLRMPVRPGTDLLFETQKMTDRNFVIILITGHGALDHDTSVSKLGFDAILSKPLDIGEIMKAIT